MTVITIPLIFNLSDILHHVWHPTSANLVNAYIRHHLCIVSLENHPQLVLQLHNHMCNRYWETLSQASSLYTCKTPNQGFLGVLHEWDPPWGPPRTTPYAQSCKESEKYTLVV